MSLKNVLGRPLEEQYIAADDPIYEKINEIQAETGDLVAELNQGPHTKNQINEMLGKIIGEDVDPSINLLLPFYTDFGRQLSLGKDLFINRGVMIADLGGVEIEDGVLIGPFAKILAVGHAIDPKLRHGVQLDPIHIKKNAWIGADATILPGVTVGENSVVAADATVTKNVPANTVVAGTPAKFMKDVR